MKRINTAAAEPQTFKLRGRSALANLSMNGGLDLVNRS